MNKIIDCVEIANGIKEAVKESVSKLTIKPKLVVIQVGDNPASTTYVRNKMIACEKCGIESEVIKVSERATQQALEVMIENLNNDTSVTGLLVQLPLPSHMDEQRIAELIRWDKDVDGFHPYLQGKLLRGEDLDSIPQPCTAMGCIRILEHEGVDLTGKRMVVVGRSNIVGKPVGLLGLHNNATVTMCHSKTMNLRTWVQQAEVVVTAVGSAKMFDKTYFSNNTHILDVGINRDENGKLCGDCNMESILEQRQGINITPVPRGLGTLTVACLMENTLRCYKLQHQQ